jgi:predicted O-methyltransferase YrrM
MDLNVHPSSHYESVVITENRNALIQQVKQNAFGYMDELEGWCSKGKASVLIDLVFMLEPKIIVEIGVWGGKSLVPMAAALKVTGEGKIFGIDPWESQASIIGMDDINRDWWGSVDHSQILRGLQEKIVKFALMHQIYLVKSTSADAPIITNIDMIHIDGNHSEEASTLDVKKWVPCVRKGGIIIFDDITWSTNNGTAVKWLNENCIKFVEFHEGNDWGIWIKP